MIKLSAPVAMSVFAFAVAAPTAAVSQPPAADGEIAALMETSRAWARAAASGDPAAIMSYWTEDALVIMPAMPTFRGKQAIRSYVEESLRIPGFSITWEPIEGAISASGDMGYLIERTTFTMNDPSGELVTQEARAVTIWKKQPDGSWRNVVDIATPAPHP